jgi:hypothetical protein
LALAQILLISNQLLGHLVYSCPKGIAFGSCFVDYLIHINFQNRFTFVSPSEDADIAEPMPIRRKER